MMAIISGRNMPMWRISVTRLELNKKKSRWLRCYATSRKVPGSNSDEANDFFISPNTSSRIMALGFTQPLTEMSTRNRKQNVSGE
jgi:hypothetical protein